MRSLVDATALPENRGGVARAVDELIVRLPQHGIDTHVAAQPRDVEMFTAALGADHVHPVPRWAVGRGQRLAWEQTGLPVLVRRLRPDVLHSPHYTMPIVSSFGSTPKNVVSLYDATFFSHPELHTRLKREFFRRWTSISARRADALVSPSEATRSEVARYVGVDPARITVIPLGVDHDQFRPPTPQEAQDVREWLGLTPREPYIAFLGTLEPRKNVPALVRAYASLSHDGTPPPLVLAGGRGWDEHIDEALSAVPSDRRVLRPGFVPDGLVAALLGSAEVVAYPAFGEGFGLPVLEAMACGTAVLTTRGLSLPEVGGDAVCYAESATDRDLAVALGGLLEDPAERDRLGAAAVERASRFSWDEVARAHAELYRRVVSS